MTNKLLYLPSEYTYGDILRAYIDCRRRKRNKKSSVAFEINFEHNLENLLEEIHNETYTIGRTQVFAVTKPKPREVWAANFRDRIVHHLIYNSIGVWYESRFIPDTYSCIKGRGTLAASQRVEQLARRVTGNWAKPAWVLQVDIANFFVSISREKLWEILEKDLGSECLTARLVKQVVFHDPTRNPKIKAHSDFDAIPRHKSLWHCKKGYGLPIGNLTSQFFSNVYLDGADKFAKHVLKAKNYVRYVDDIVFISESRDELISFYSAYDEWLRSNRGLRLHPSKTRLAPLHHGINFVGRIVLPYRTYPRRMTVLYAKNAVAKIREDPLNKKHCNSLQSYIGLMHHYSTYNLRKKLCDTASLSCFIDYDREATKLITLT